MEMNLFMERTEVLSIPLYKYYGNLDYAKDVIENNRIHFESPVKYNDIFDSATYVKDEQLEQFVFPKKLLLNAFELCLEPTEFETRIFNEQFVKLYEEKDTLCVGTCLWDFFKCFPYIPVEWVMNVLRTVMSIKNIVVQPIPRITCFSENRDSLLMWSYYADSHRGVCLEFDLHKDENLSKHCYKVQYSRLFDIGDKSRTYFTKSEQWQHEQEWRIVSSGPEYEQTNSLKSIYLGYKMSPKDRLEFFQLGVKYKLDVFFVNPSITEYKLEFTQCLKDGELLFPKKY